MLTLTKNVTGLKQNTDLDEIERLNQDLYHYFKEKFHVDISLSRALVSFQANKNREVYRWYKFKEAFSASLVEYLLEKGKIVNGTILDPFAGSGTALFAATCKRDKRRWDRIVAHCGQQMLSCTVENRTKDLLAMNHDWAEAIAAADQQEVLQAVLKYLDEQKAQGLLNNNGIPRMVRGYFYEMACVIAECSRVLKPNAPLFMVNDNVRFAGASISADMILSSIAEKLGFRVENILVLPNGKGNSSQQMGKHGREMLRKCVYIWRRTEGSNKRTHRELS